jgi:hypothetical protein
MDGFDCSSDLTWMDSTTGSYFILFPCQFIVRTAPTRRDITYQNDALCRPSLSSLTSLVKITSSDLRCSSDIGMLWMKFSGSGLVGTFIPFTTVPYFPPASKTFTKGRMCSLVPSPGASSLIKILKCLREMVVVPFVITVTNSNCIRN